MSEIEAGPVIRVGLKSARLVEITLAGQYRTSSGNLLEPGDYAVEYDGGRVRLATSDPIVSPVLSLIPVDLETCRARIHGITIGVGFHWQRRESQDFQGEIEFLPAEEHLQVINQLPLESYLISVISSEMSASSPAELLASHAVVSRSWLMAQMHRRFPLANHAVHETVVEGYGDNPQELIRWYDRENHSLFDVCADDHCQRYQGISKAFSQAAFDAVTKTRGMVLTYGDEICDARYSKSCGGMTEEFRAAWEDRDVPYLAPVYDGPAAETPSFSFALADEANARSWIEASPQAYCNVKSPELLARILPAFDQETTDHYRWSVEYSQDELSELLESRLRMNLGAIETMTAVRRGKSGRIIRLKITGENRTIVIGKELEIRRALSASHLYSSALVIYPVRDRLSIFPDRFILRGAGWGHGVGLCQIGAAVMADRGFTHQEILAHYFRGASLTRVY